jgi:DNA-binding protein H-NS
LFLLSEDIDYGAPASILSGHVPGRVGAELEKVEFMAKKAKRRGRPPGARSPVKMEVGQLRQHIDGLEKLLRKKVGEQQAYFEQKLSELSGFASKKAKALRAVATGKGRKGKRAKAAPKYRSRKNSSVTWSGRGMTPVWMREEMKGTKLKKDDFLIK